MPKQSAAPTARALKERKPKTKDVNIHYRKADGPPWSNARTLQQALGQALASTEEGTEISRCARLRLKWFGEDGLFINVFQYSRTADAYFGDLILYSANETQSLLNDGHFDKPVVSVSQQEAPPDTKYIDSTLYWMIKGNHVLLIQTASIRADSFEKYLEWLLLKAGCELSADSKLTLTGRFDKNEIPGGLQAIQEIIIGGGFAGTGRALLTDNNRTPWLLPEDERSFGVESPQRRQTLDGLMSAFESFFGGRARVDDILDRIPRESEVTVSVHIGYKAKTALAQTPLKELETELRHIPDEFIGIRAKDGQVLANGRIRLQCPNKVRLVGRWSEEGHWIGSLLDFKDVVRAFRESFQEMLTAGRITDR